MAARKRRDVDRKARERKAAADRAARKRKAVDRGAEKRKVARIRMISSPPVVV